MKEEKETTWGDVMWMHIMKGLPREEAIFQADEWEKRKNRKRDFERHGPTNRKHRRSALQQKESK